MDELEKITKHQQLDPFLRMQAFITLASLSQDQEDIYHYMDDTHIGTSYPQYWLAFTSFLQTKGQYPKIVSILRKLKKTRMFEFIIRFQGQQQKIKEYQGRLEKTLQDIINVELKVVKQRALLDPRAQKISLLDNQIIQIDDIKIFVDKDCREKLDSIVKSYQKYCSNYIIRTRQKLFEQLKKRPISWVTKQAKKYNLIYQQLNHQKIQEYNKALETYLDYSTPQKQKKSIGKQTDFQPFNKQIDSVQILKRKGIHRSPKFNKQAGSSVKKIVANIPHRQKKVRFGPITRKIENIRSNQDVLKIDEIDNAKIYCQFSFSKGGRQEESRQQEDDIKEELMLNKVIADSQQQYHCIEDNLSLDSQKQNKKPDEQLFFSPSLQSLLEQQIRPSYLTKITQTSKQNRSFRQSLSNLRRSL